MDPLLNEAFKQGLGEFVILAIMLEVVLVAGGGLLAHPILVYLGRISSGLYIFHQTVPRGRGARATVPAAQDALHVRPRPPVSFARGPPARGSAARIVEVERGARGPSHQHPLAEGVQRQHR